MCGPRKRAGRAEDADRVVPSHTFALAHPLDDFTRLAAADAVPDAVVEIQLQRGGAVEVALGGQPSHAVKAVAGASGLDGGEVPGRSRWHRRRVIVLGGAKSNHGAIVRRPTHSTSHRTTHSSTHRRDRGMQWKGLRAPATHSNTHRTSHSNTHRPWSQPCEWRGPVRPRIGNWYVCRDHCARNLVVGTSPRAPFHHSRRWSARLVRTRHRVHRAAALCSVPLAMDATTNSLVIDGGLPFRSRHKLRKRISPDITLIYVISGGCVE